MPYRCEKCGAVVNGNYCCVCGTKAISPLKQFRKEKRRRKGQFLQCLTTSEKMLAEACWAKAEEVCETGNPATNQIDPVFGDCKLHPYAYIWLDQTEKYAKTLFDLTKIVFNVKI